VKKIIFILSVLAVGTLCQVSAQKFGHVNATEIMLLMPEMKRVEHVLDSFQTVLDNDLKLEYEKYQKIEEKLKTQMAANLSEKLIQLTQQELQGQYENIQRKQQAYEQEVSEKQNLLIKPLNDKILKAIKDVCTEKGLNYVFDISKGALVYWDEKDDVNKDVRKKLGIAEDAKLPQNATNNNK
jgi:outer membrane protein